MKMLDKFGQGRHSVIKEMICFVKKEIDSIKNESTAGVSSPRQISNGGKLKAYRKVLDKLNVKLDRTVNKNKQNE